MDSRGGLCAEAHHIPRWVRIFSITAGCSVKAMIRMVPAQRGDEGVDLVTCLINRAQARSAAKLETTLNYTPLLVPPRM